MYVIIDFSRFENSKLERQDYEKGHEKFRVLSHSVTNCMLLQNNLA
jgi:hypothetical protein